MGAEKMLREKVLVGLVDAIDGPIDRIRAVLDIDKKLSIHDRKRVDICLDKYKSTPSLTSDDISIPVGDEEYAALARLNYHDVILYTKAQYVFFDQDKVVKNMIKEAEPSIGGTILDRLNLDESHLNASSIHFAR